MKNILVPTDFSENSFNAFKYALTLYKEEKCRFHVLNTFTPTIAHYHFSMSTTKRDPENKTSTASDEKLEVIVRRARDEFSNPNHTFKTHSSINPLIEEIKEIVDKESIELIILGNKGNSNLEQVFLGSNAVWIIKSIKKCPMLIVPDHVDFVVPNEIAFTTDFNKFYTNSEIVPISNLAKSFNATVRIVHTQKEIKSLTDVQKFNLNVLRKHLSEVEYYVHTIFEAHSMSQTLEVFAEELQIHLLAMLNYPESYIRQLAAEPTVKQRDFYTKIPLLIIPELSDVYLYDIQKNRKLVNSF